jgi:prolyl oligopeptidase
MTTHIRWTHAALLAAVLFVPVAALTRPASTGPTAQPRTTDTTSSPAGLAYPQTRTVDHVDTYFGTAVPDPYRWLEDDNAEETARWVAAQNAVTFGYLEKIPFRAALKARLEKVYDYPKYSAPSRKGPYFFFTKNEGLQNQSVHYVQKGLDGSPEVLLDPNTWSDDGTVRLTTFSASKDARHAVYGVSRSGSDWQEYKVIEIATRKPLSDSLQWIKVSGAAWHGNGFYYSRYPAPEKGRELSSRNEHHEVYYHRLGTPQAQDELVYRDPANPQRFHGVGTTEDERFAILTISERGKGKKGNALLVRDLAKGEREFRPVVPAIGDDSFGVVDNDGDTLIVWTDRAAPNGRLVAIDPARPDEANWKILVPERPEPLQGASSAGGRLFLRYLKDVTTRAYVHRLDGTLEHELQLPGIGSAAGFSGERDDAFVFYTFSSMEQPPTIYRFDIDARRSRAFREPQIAGYDPAAFESRQVFFTSRDGTRVPMFLVHRKGLVLDGSNPALLYGYGGFNVSQTPSFNALRLALLEQGFVYASANLRGGGEYGEAWHEAGTKLKKQNVFDDFIAAAEWLIANKYTSPAKLAMQGGSNGGLLVGAVMNQRPELFRVAIPQVGVMDMLRFHTFTIGWNWIADYGSSDNPEQFKALYAYSPLHNIKAGATYPATLVTTADHDDRVVPAHSFKYAATLQARAARTNPVLIRIETKSGHGASSTSKQLETTADIYAFIMHNMGITPRQGSH